jgi:rhamnose utilization protein RhaD (predicted bifunctional aldolase and dehydrogenase)
MTKENTRKEVQDYCVKVGGDRLFTQGAGGNVSWKDGDLLYIKASGTWLADANNKDIFLPVDLQALHTNMTSGIFSMPENISKNNDMKPSIETMMHAILPHVIVVHLHVVDVLSILVRKDAKFIIDSVFSGKISYIFIDYIKPGPDLAESIYRNTLNNAVDVIFLKNHGIVIGGNDIQEVQNKLEFILKESQSHGCIQKLPLNCNDTSNLVIDGYNILDIPEVNELACNHELLDKIDSNWALYPDHVVFLGERPNLTTNIEYGRNFVSSQKVSYIIVRDCGVYINDNALKSVVAQLVCYADVLVRQSKNHELNPLSSLEIDELINWDSEKFRVNNSI